MNNIDSSLNRFESISPERLAVLNLANHKAIKFICSEQQLPALLQDVSDSYQIFEADGDQVFHFQNNCEGFSGEEKTAEFRKLVCELGVECKVFHGFQRLALTNQSSLITIDFNIQYLSYSGWLVSFESLVVVSVYFQTDQDDAALIGKISAMAVPENTYNRFDINLLLLYSHLRLNMPNANVKIIGGLRSTELA